MTPHRSEVQGQATFLVFQTADCRYGALLVAGTARGICAIELGDSREDMASRFRQRFPEAQCKPEDPCLTQWLPAVLAYLDDPNRSLNVPLDIQGTPFQRKVWAALQGIPAGTTLTYSELARKIGQPSAVRAVGNACARNVAGSGHTLSSRGADRQGTGRFSLGSAAQGGHSATRIRDVRHTWIPVPELKHSVPALLFPAWLVLGPAPGTRIRIRNAFRFDFPLCPGSRPRIRAHRHWFCLARHARLPPPPDLRVRADPVRHKGK